MSLVSTTDEEDNNIMRIPTEEQYVLGFNLFSAYSQWIMKIEGQGPIDKRVFVIDTSHYGLSKQRTLTLRKGNSYKITVNWVKTYLAGWEGRYDWSLQFGEGGFYWPNSLTFLDYSQTCTMYLMKVHENGMAVDNADGLITAHVLQRYYGS